MAVEHGESTGNEPAVVEKADAAGKGNDPVLSAFADLVGDMALDLTRGIIGPAMQGMHEEWRTEAELLRRDTAEWVARVNASRQHMEQVVEKQHELAQEVYNSHARLLQEMAAFQKERRDTLQWQEQVTSGLNRLGELQRELSVESSRIAGVVRDIISELARYQSNLEKRYDRFEEKVNAAVGEQIESVRQQLGAATTTVEEAMEALSKTNEETRSVLARDVAALRREVQETATRAGREATENRTALQQYVDQRVGQLGQENRASFSKVLAILATGQVLTLAGLVYLIVQMAS